MKKRDSSPEVSKRHSRLHEFLHL